jgi:hypothetical protein
MKSILLRGRVIQQKLRDYPDKEKCYIIINQKIFIDKETYGLF